MFSSKRLLCGTGFPLGRKHGVEAAVAPPLITPNDPLGILCFLCLQLSTAWLNEGLDLPKGLTCGREHSKGPGKL